MKPPRSSFFARNWDIVVRGVETWSDRGWVALKKWEACGMVEDGDTASLEYVYGVCGSPYRLTFLHSSRHSVGI